MRTTNLPLCEEILNNRFIGPRPMIYSEVLLFMTNDTFRQCNPKQKHKREQIGMRKNALISLKIPIMWEPVAEPDMNPRKRLRRSMQRAELTLVADYNVCTDQQARSKRHT